MNPIPRTRWILTEESFEELLAWLNPDREQAGEKYEDIRNRLIRIFIHRGCMSAEDLADKTINKVARKVHDLREYYVGDPAHYFYGTARNVYFEYSTDQAELTVLPEVIPAPVPDGDPEESESQHKCLDECLQNMTPKDRDLLLEYYREEEGAKIEQHKEMARRLGITINALRIMIYRLRTSLKKCMHNCLASDSA